jgi:hypothetical protein
MTRKILALSSLLAFLAGVTGFELAARSIRSATPPEEIAPCEAEILIYLLPEAQELRKQGMDIGWELQTSDKLNQRDFYTFWVINSKRPNTAGSVTVGYFSVNKHTAEVWDTNSDRVVGAAEIEGVQRILRRAHHIDEETLHKFGSLRP